MSMSRLLVESIVSVLAYSVCIAEVWVSPVLCGCSRRCVSVAGVYMYLACQGLFAIVGRG